MTYKGIKHIRYLEDVLTQNTNISYKKLDL